MGVVPARSYKPRDKAKIENGVQVCERWIAASLRQRKFFGVAPNSIRRSASYWCGRMSSRFANATDRAASRW